MEAGTLTCSGGMGQALDSEWPANALATLSHPHKAFLAPKIVNFHV